MEEQARRDVVRYSHLVHARGWVANHDGNLSVRVGEGRYVCTPTAVSKGCVTPETLLVVDRDGNRLEGSRKVFSEWKLHRACYGARADVAAVLHAHPPTATAFAVTGVEPGGPFMAEPVVSLGARIPLVPYRIPGHADEASLLAEALAEADAALLAGHGVVVVGPDLETCFLRMELVEHVCHIALLARQLGGPRPLPEADVQALLEKRRAAGLGPAGAGGAGPAASNSTSSWDPQPAGGNAMDIVAEALRRLGG